METKRFKDKNGREWICGKGTADEVDQLNIEKDFDREQDRKDFKRLTRKIDKGPAF